MGIVNRISMIKVITQLNKTKTRYVRYWIDVPNRCKKCNIKTQLDNTVLCVDCRKFRD